MGHRNRPVFNGPRRHGRFMDLTPKIKSRIADRNQPDRLSWSTNTRPSTITIPERANPMAKLVFHEMKKQNISYYELEWRSGVLISTFKAWRTENAPGLASIEAALGALGWALVPVPVNISDEVRELLEPASLHFISDQEAFGAALAAAANFPAYSAADVAAMRERRLAKRKK